MRDGCYAATTAFRRKVALFSIVAALVVFAPAPASAGPSSTTHAGWAAGRGIATSENHSIALTFGGQTIASNSGAATITAGSTNIVLIAREVRLYNVPFGPGKAILMLGDLIGSDSYRHGAILVQEHSSLGSPSVAVCLSATGPVDRRSYWGSIIGCGAPDAFYEGPFDGWATFVLGPVIGRN